MVTEEEKQQAKSIGLEPEVVFNTISDRRILAVQTEDTHETIMEIFLLNISDLFHQLRMYISSALPVAM